MKKVTLELTDREVIALLIAIDITENSYAGWTSEELGSDTRQDLKALSRIQAKLEK